jgi:hypothetical protein
MFWCRPISAPSLTSSDPSFLPVILGTVRKVAVDAEYAPAEAEVQVHFQRVQGFENDVQLSRIMMPTMRL